MEETTGITDRAVSAWLRDHMKKQGIRQRDIADLIDRKSVTYVSNCLTGKQSWRLSELDRIAPLFGLHDALSLIADSRAYTPMLDRIFGDEDERIRAAEQAARSGDWVPAADEDEDKTHEINGEAGDAYDPA
ncbi:helix-turn-helix transcriptional regulator [uncultured Bifidobacterium sp.]|uniref:helix-turn-helix domain-containing protein n=1 Tax=uncultured Bifidobacterium sp. TaxID=165187 RepID=UPI00338E2C87